MYQKITLAIFSKMKGCQFDQNFDRQDFLLFVCSSDLKFGDLAYLKFRSLLEDGPVIHLHLNHHITNFIASHSL